MPGPGARAGHDLDRVREELRRRGYLSGEFERFLLQDARRPRRPLPTLFLLAGKVGLRTGFALALAFALWLAAANGALAASPFDLAVLFFHLLPPLALAAGATFLAVGALTVLVLRRYHVRRIEALTFAAAAAVGAATVALALWRGRDLALAERPTELAALAVVAPVLLYALVKSIHGGLLALSLRLAEEPAEGWELSRGWLGFAVAATLLVLALPAISSARRPPAEPPGAFPARPGGRALLIGLDGVLASELDYLLARGELPALGALAASGAVLSYPRGAEPPASFWTSVATGRADPDHGVAALDGFRPLGARTTLMRSGPLRPYWDRIAVPLGLAEHRPLLSSRRSAFALWELASRGGEPVLAVDWWATFPAAPLPGLVVAHGGAGLLAERAEGAVAPAGEAPRLAALAAATLREGPPSELGGSLPRADLARLDRRALAPDRFYRRAFADGLALAPKAAALYLAALDVAADGWAGSGIAFADLVRRELRAADALLGTARSGFDTVAVVIDPGRRGAGSAREGRVVLWRAAGCRGRRAIRPEQVASALVRALGLPQSAELPAPPAVCGWPVPPAVVDTFGSPVPSSAPARESGEYLENLRSLGYL